MWSCCSVVVHEVVHGVIVHIAASLSACRTLAVCMCSCTCACCLCMSMVCDARARTVAALAHARLSILTPRWSCFAVCPWQLTIANAVVEKTSTENVDAQITPASPSKPSTAPPVERGISRSVSAESESPPSKANTKVAPAAAVSTAATAAASSSLARRAPSSHALKAVPSSQGLKASPSKAKLWSKLRVAVEEGHQGQRRCMSLGVAGIVSRCLCSGVYKVLGRDGV